MVHDPSRRTSERPGKNQVRGQAFLSLDGAVVDVLGHEARERLLDALPVPIGYALRFRSFATSEWYPIEWYLESLEIARTLASDTPDLVRRLAYAATQYDLNGVHRFFLRLVSPGMALSQASRILGLFLRQYEVEILERGAASARIALRIPGANDDYWEDLAGTAEALLEGCGVHDVKVSIERGAREAEATVSGTWRPD